MYLMYLIYIIPLLKCLYFLLLMLQLDHYKTICLKHYLKRYYLKTPYLIATYFSIFLFLKIIYVNIFVYLIILLVSLFKSKYILKLKFTKRIIRLLIVIFLISSLIIIFNPSVSSFLIVIYTLPFIVMLSNIILYPVEKYIKYFYKQKTKKKLSQIKPYIVCITGSYGKTSVKEMLYTIYKDKYLCLKTPKSYNTPMGISKTVLNELEYMTELFFVEAGATTKGDIDEICKMIKPDVGVISSIGPQHLNSFKTINNILKTKLELSDNLPPHGKLILNYKSEYLNGILNDSIKETIKANSNELYAKNIKQTDIYTEFDIYSFNKPLIHIKTRLLGINYIDNIVLCYAVKLALDDKYYISNEEFMDKVLELTNPLHRLSTYEIIKNNTKYRFIDDSYNSNIEGFKQALLVLTKLTGIKILLTPGIVDNNSNDFIKMSYNICHFKELDDIVLVNNKEIKPLKNLLKQNNVNYTLVNSLNDGLNLIYSKYNEYHMEVINILLENDLPDNYLMR